MNKQAELIERLEDLKEWHIQQANNRKNLRKKVAHTMRADSIHKAITELQSAQKENERLDGVLERLGDRKLLIDDNPALSNEAIYSRDYMARIQYARNNREAGE